MVWLGLLCRQHRHHRGVVADIERRIAVAPVILPIIVVAVVTIVTVVVRGVVMAVESLRVHREVHTLVVLPSKLAQPGR